MSNLYLIFIFLITFCLSNYHIVIALGKWKSQVFPSFLMNLQFQVSGSNSKIKSKALNDTKITNDAECENGVCSIPVSPRNPRQSLLDLEKEMLKKRQINETPTVLPTSDSSDTDNSSISPIHNSNTTESSSNSDAIQQIVSLGWNQEEATNALNLSNNNIEEAIEFLTKEDETKEELNSKVKELYEVHYWGKDISEFALKEANMNISLALEFLQQEESALEEQFSSSVEDLVKNGWDEFIARQALLAQWTLEQRRSNGINDTVPIDVLQSIRPTLRRINETDTSKSKSEITKATTAKSPKSNPPKPAKREDCIFEVSSDNFQKIVLESPVPVLVDLYADWCGPCKQLGPMLENAAIKSGGIFRLAKVNVDKNRDIVDTVHARGFPTVFTVKNGKFDDRFVGLLPPEQLQDYIVRAVTGFGERVQANEVSDEELKEITQAISIQAGLSSLTFKKKEKLNNMVHDIFFNTESDAWTTTEFSPGIKTVIAYMQNIIDDIRNPKYRIINMKSKSYQSKIEDSNSAKELLRVLGFRPKNVNGTNDLLELQHSNTAIIHLIRQKVLDCGKEKKFQKTHMKMPTNAPISSPTSVPSNDVTVVYRSANAKVIRRQHHNTNTLRDILLDVMPHEEEWKEYDKISIQSPIRQMVSIDSEDELSSSLIGDKTEIIFTLLKKEKKANPRKNVSTRPSTKSNTTTASMRRKKTNTLHSSGILNSNSNKFNEYFGGDSTVFLAGPELQPETPAADVKSNSTSTQINTKEDNPKTKKD